MIQIKDLLGKFSKILETGEGSKQLVLEVIREVTGILIETKDIKIKNGVIYLDIKPIYKNEIFLKKDQIFSKLKETLGKKSPQDFR